MLRALTVCTSTHGRRLHLDEGRGGGAGEGEEGFGNLRAKRHGCPRHQLRSSGDRCVLHSLTPIRLAISTRTPLLAETTTSAARLGKCEIRASSGALLLCCSTLTRLPPGTDVAKCSFCGAASQRSFQGRTCPLCQMGEIGARVGKQNILDAHARSLGCIRADSASKRGVRFVRRFWGYSFLRLRKRLAPGEHSADPSSLLDGLWKDAPRRGAAERNKRLAGWLSAHWRQEPDAVGTDALFLARAKQRWSLLNPSAAAMKGPFKFRSAALDATVGEAALLQALPFRK